MKKKQVEKSLIEKKDEMFLQGKKRLLVRGGALCLSAALCLGMLGGCGVSEGTRSADSGYAMNAGAMKSSGSNGASYSASESATDLWSEGAAYDYDGMGDAAKPTNESLSQTSASKRKLIRNVSMNVETQEYDVLMAKLEERIKELGGHVQNMESYNGSRYNYGTYSSNRGTRKYATVVARIPQQRLDEFVGSVSDLGNVVNRSESVNDVTLQYVDMQSHKEALQVEQKRLLELLERAEILEDIITLENRLTNIRYQIESMESSLRTFDDQVDYSTVNIRIDEVEVYTPVVVEEKNAWQRMTEGFVESLVAVKDGFVEFFVWFVIHLPYLVVWAIFITAIVFIVKAIRKKKRMKKEKMLQKMQQNVEDKTSAPLNSDKAQTTDQK